MQHIKINNNDTEYGWLFPSYDLLIFIHIYQLGTGWCTQKAKTYDVASKGKINFFFFAKTEYFTAAITLL